MRNSDFVLRLFDLRNKTIVLTGAAGLLGTQYAHALIKAGANVVLVDTESKKNKELEKKLNEKYNANTMSFNVDITKQSDVAKLTNEVVKEYKKIDGLVNNATFNPKMQTKIINSLEQYPLELWEKYLSTNITGVFLCCKHIGKVMVKQKNGVIVNISSIYGNVGVDQRIYGKDKIGTPLSYAVTKAAIINLTRYLAAYWYGKNIRVNTLSLGGVYNNQDRQFVRNYSKRTMLNRMARKDEYNGALIFLLSPASSYMIGANLIIDGGWTAW